MGSCAELTGGEREAYLERQREYARRSQRRRRNRRDPDGRRLYCKRGHPFDEANTYVHPGTGKRYCRRCKRMRQRRYKRRQRRPAKQRIYAARYRERHPEYRARQKASARARYQHHRDHRERKKAAERERYRERRSGAAAWARP